MREKVDVRIIAATKQGSAQSHRKPCVSGGVVLPHQCRHDRSPAFAGRVATFLCWCVISRKVRLELGKTVPRFSEKAMEAMQNYAWPGNARELENVIQRIVVMNDEQTIEVRTCRLSPGSRSCAPPA